MFVCMCLWGVLVGEYGEMFVYKGVCVLVYVGDTED